MFGNRRAKALPFRKVHMVKRYLGTLLLNGPLRRYVMKLICPSWQMSVWTRQLGHSSMTL